MKSIAKLLGRSARPLPKTVALPIVEGKRVLITGAGGSIGTELAIRVASLGPLRLTLLNHSELALYHVHRGVSRNRDFVAAALVDVRDFDHLYRTFAAEEPDLVFHAAAMKHVPLCEENPEAAVLTNVFGTKNVLDVCARLGAELVMISTDKAVHPTSVMGRTKRVAELICASARGTARVVRFGNVLGSSGSVLPLFKEQLARGGPLTVTHPEVTRYFMTVREAVGLTLAAATLEGHLFVLDMGEPVAIADLARRYAATQGRSDVEVVFTGLRPGEKLTEALFYDAETPLPTAIPGVLRGRVAHVGKNSSFFEGLAELERAALAGAREGVLRTLGQLAP